MLSLENFFAKLFLKLSKYVGIVVNFEYISEVLNKESHNFDLVKFFWPYHMFDLSKLFYLQFSIFSLGQIPAINN